MMTRSKSHFAAACLALAAWVPLHATAGLLDDDEARKAIIDLRAKVDNLDRDMRASVDAKLDTKLDKSAALEFTNQNEQTLQEIAKLRGQVEVLSNELANAQKRQKDFYTDLDARLRKLEPRQMTIDGKESVVDPSEQKDYESAMAQVKSGDYKGGAAALSAFVHRYPTSAYAAMAQYWLGNAYYAQGDYKSAIAAQEVVASTYRDSTNAPEALLNIAASYDELKDKKAAKKVRLQLIKQYPDSAAAKAAKDQLRLK